MDSHPTCSTVRERSDLGGKRKWCWGSCPWLINRFLWVAGSNNLDLKSLFRTISVVVESECYYVECCWFWLILCVIVVFSIIGIVCLIYRQILNYISQLKDTSRIWIHLVLLEWWNGPYNKVKEPSEFSLGCKYPLRFSFVILHVSTSGSLDSKLCKMVCRYLRIASLERQHAGVLPWDAQYFLVSRETWEIPCICFHSGCNATGTLW